MVYFFDHSLMYVCFLGTNTTILSKGSSALPELKAFWTKSDASFLIRSLIRCNQDFAESRKSLDFN